MDWFFLFVCLPLIVGAIVYLCGFSGCGLNVVGSGVATPPQNLKAKAAGPNRVDLTWDYTNPVTADNFQVERSIPGGAFAPVPGGLLPSTARSFSDTGAAAGAAMVYRVGSVFPSSPILYSNEVSVTTPTTGGGGPPPPPPPPPGAVPVTHVYDSGSGSETIVVGANQLVVEVWGAGGSGRFANSISKGGGGGAYSKKTVSGPFTAGTISWSVGAGGAKQTASGNNGTAGGSSSAGGSGQKVNIAGVGGGAGGTGVTGAGGAAGTGGDVNTPGNSTATLIGGAGAGPGGGAGGDEATDGKSPGGGGGGGGLNGGDISSGAGANGRVKFSWT